MPSGLVALLDDVAGITKLAAASLDDIGAAAGKAGTKAAGVVIDDAAVTPRYVTGLTPDRELPIIAKIAVGSLRNKLLILLPIALLLSAFAPWAITPLLVLGAAYLCFEGTEKVFEALSPHAHHAGEDEPLALEAAEIEKQKVAGAVRTDFILSAEIMAIALADISSPSLGMKAAVLAAVAIAITMGVYGVVGLIVKMDDIGLHLAQRSSAGARAIGRGLVRGMPVLLRILAVVGTAAMIWVGGGIIVHAMHVYHITGFPEWLHHFAEGAGRALLPIDALVEWFVSALGSGIVGLIVGGIIVAALHLLKRGKSGHHAAEGAKTT